MDADLDAFLAASEPPPRMSVLPEFLAEEPASALADLLEGDLEEPLAEEPLFEDPSFDARFDAEREDATLEFSTERPPEGRPPTLEIELDMEEDVEDTLVSDVELIEAEFDQK